MEDINLRDIEHDEIFATLKADPGYTALCLRTPRSVEDAREFSDCIEDDIIERPTIAWVILRSGKVVPVAPLQHADFEIPDAVRLPDGRVWALGHIGHTRAETRYADTLTWAKVTRAEQVCRLAQANSDAADPT